MGSTSPSSDLYSHPGVLLEDHLTTARERAQMFFEEWRSVLPPELGEVIKVAALVHDIGKATRYFQDYLHAPEEKRRAFKYKEEVRHSLFSAVCAYYLTRRLPGVDELYPVFAFLAVRRHHGDLGWVLNDIVFNEADALLLLRQLEGVEADRFAILAQKLGLADLTKETLKHWFSEFSRDARKIKRRLRGLDGSPYNYLLLNFIFSLLLDADKTSVVVRDHAVFNRRTVGGVELVENYRGRVGFPATPLNEMRTRVYYETLAHPPDPDVRIYALNIPTGLGKTLAAFAFALKLRQVLESRFFTKPRIIYALPYLSIIEQTVERLKAVFAANRITPDSTLLLEHHHRAGLVYHAPYDDELEFNAAELLVEGWNSEIVITTFVQLFHTLFSNRNRSLRKFHRLAGAIIILDEVQAVPTKYWLLLRETFRTLAERFNTYLIFVTATQPLIIEDARPLVKNFTDYFAALDRVVLKPRIAPEMGVADLLSMVDFADDRRYLFVLNTIACAREFYNLLVARGIPATYLSTHVVPKERIRRIEEIKQGRHRVAVTTQLVEAGVDIDFDIVVRDIAPLDAVIQAAGRCNRNGFRRGEVYLVKLKDENGRPFASYIYDHILLDITESLFRGKSAVREREFLELIEIYYRALQEKKSQDESRKYLEAINRLHYDSGEEEVKISDFRLIEEKEEKIDVFVELDEAAGAVWQRYIEISKLEDFFKRRQEFDKIKAEFYQYVISVPRTAENLPPGDGELRYVGRNLLDDYYHPATGFMVRDPRAVFVC